MVIYGLIDIDDFTAFNIKNGYENGNEVLTELENVSNKILSPLYWRKLDSDEFIFSINGSFEQNRFKFSELLLKCKKHLNITVSIGLTELNNECSFDKIINQLKSNLLIAKRHGKNKFCIK